MTRHIAGHGTGLGLQLHYPHQDLSLLHHNFTFFTSNIQQVGKARHGTYTAIAMFSLKSLCLLGNMLVFLEGQSRGAQWSLKLTSFVIVQMCSSRL